MLRRAPLRSLLAGFAAALALLGSHAASAEPPHRGPWSVTDVKGRPFSSKAVGDRALIVFVMTADQKGQARPAYERLLLRFGGEARLTQLSLVDLRDAPATWVAAEAVADTVTERVREVHDWTRDHLRALLKAEGRPDLPDLDRQIHIALDWDGALARRFGVREAPAEVTLVLSLPDGRLIGPFTPASVGELIAAVEAALPAEPSPERGAKP